MKFLDLPVQSLIMMSIDMSENKLLKIAVYQMNSIVGDLDGNTEKLINHINQAKLNNADIFIAPELAICGYPPEDLLLRRDFYLRSKEQIDRLLLIDGIIMIIGCPYRIGTDNFNSLLVLSNGNILGRYDKMLLPNYGVFDECRYFTPGVSSLVFPVNGVNCGVVICEDMWDSVPIAEAKEFGAELVLVANASPFEQDKHEERLQVARYRVEENGLPIIYLNQVGGQDELVFDGASFALNAAGNMVYQASAYCESLDYLSFSHGELNQGSILAYPVTEARIYAALKLALNDYVGKNGFKGIVLGLSGGIDSALTLAIAVDALGADRVMAVMMPSQYTAEISVVDSREMVDVLKVSYEEIMIKPMFDQFIDSLAPVFNNMQTDTTEENLQARIRGNLLMAISNKLGYLVVTTGNKSEMTTGYATLYGDMAGGFALLKDVTKTQVYELSKWRNTQGKIIPERIITRAPSAELRDNQCDQDSLPDYAILDAILVDLIENNLSVTEIVAKGFISTDVDKVARLLKFNEYKRRQAAVGPKISRVSFGKDWRYPNTNKFRL